MSKHTHNIDTVLINVTDNNIEEKMKPHNDEVIKMIKILGMSEIKVSTKIVKASRQEIHIQSLIERGEIEVD